MSYRIELSRGAHKALVKEFPLSDTKKIRTKIEKLKTDPFPIGSEKLAGNEELFRIRSGDYRIIYQVHNKRLVILVIKIGHRREVYR